MKNITIAAGLILALSLGTASANPFQDRTEAGAGLFDQGGEHYNHSAQTDAPSAEYGYPGISLDSTSSVQDVQTPSTTGAVPADNPHNEAGQSMFDGQR